LENEAKKALFLIMYNPGLFLSIFLCCFFARSLLDIRDELGIFEAVLGLIRGGKNDTIDFFLLCMSSMFCSSRISFLLLVLNPYLSFMLLAIFVN
jgi:hypothetical protein